VLVTHRAVMEDNKLATVDLICVDQQHIDIGRDVPDGYGALKLHERRWAYCSAALPEARHHWKETGGVEFAEIRHKELPALPKPRAAAD
jgi:hypothetical protein